MLNRKAKLNSVNAGLSSARRLRRARNAIARRAAARPERASNHLVVPRPLIVAYQGSVGIVVCSGELIGPFVPPLYGVCMVHPDGSLAALDLEMLSPFPGDIRETLHFCFSPDAPVDGLLSVCDLLPPDLSHASPWDVGAFDLALCLDGPLTTAQRASISQARALCDAGSAGAADGQRVQ